jgi:hypothetical protein
VLTEFVIVCFINKDTTELEHALGDSCIFVETDNYNKFEKKNSFIAGSSFFVIYAV